MSQNQEQHQEFVSIDDIESTLASEWATLASQVERHTGSPPLRSHIQTLVIVTSNVEEARLAHELIHQLRPACPSRVIILQLGGEAGVSQARVWAHCELGKNVANRSFDVIEVTLSEELIYAAPNIISRHKLTDMSVVLYWWGAIDFSTSIFTRISRTADRLVFDSSCFDHPLQAICDVASVFDTSATRQVGTDLAWRKLSIWRQLVAQSFDLEPISRLAENVRSIGLTYSPGYQAEAVLLAGWLAYSLNWRPDSASLHAKTIVLSALTEQDEHCRISLTEDAKPGTGLNILRIGVDSGSNSLIVVIKHGEDDRSTVSINTPSMMNLERTVQHTEPSHVRLVSEELLQIERDAVYEQSLSVTTKFAQLCLQQERTTHA